MTQGNTAKKRARGRRARRVFHGTLAAELNDRGAATVEELYLRFDCFLLPLERNEIKQVLESARREGVVAEVPDKRDGYGGKVSDQWTTTDKGKKLRRPRTFALPDLAYLLFGEHDRVAKVFDMGKTLAAVVVSALALLGIKHWDPGVATKWAVFVGVGAAVVSIVGYSLAGELDLRSAAASWPRLKVTRRMRWDYQMSWPCMAYLPASIAAVYIAVGLWLGLGFFEVWLYAPLLLLAAAFYLAEVHPRYRAWHKTDPGRCRKEWEDRGVAAAEAAAREAQTS